MRVNLFSGIDQVDGKPKPLPVPKEQLSSLPIPAKLPPLMHSPKAPRDLKDAAIDENYLHYAAGSDSDISSHSRTKKKKRKVKKNNERRNESTGGDKQQGNETEPASSLKISSKTIDEEIIVLNKDTPKNLSTKLAEGENLGFDDTDEVDIASSPNSKEIEVNVVIQQPTPGPNSRSPPSPAKVHPMPSPSMKSPSRYMSDEELDNIERSKILALDQTFRSAPSSPHVSAMFQGGSRPTSAETGSRASSKPSVQIDDEVTVTSYSRRPKSGARKTRGKSAKRRQLRSAMKYSANSTTSLRSDSTVSIEVPGSPRLIANGNHHDKHAQSNGKLKKTTQRTVNPHTKSSVFTLLFCGIFAGAAALYFSIKSRRALSAGL